MQIGNPAHGQPGQVADVDLLGPGYRERQRPDRGWLVYHEQDLSVSLQLANQQPQLTLVLRQTAVQDHAPGTVNRGRVMRRLADVHPDQTIRRPVVDHHS